MTSRPLPDRDTLLMMLSAFLDGELSPEEEAVVQDALARDDGLVAALEAMSGARLESAAQLDAQEADALLADVMASVAPDAMPDTEVGALALASAALDDALEDAGRARLDALLEGPAGDVLAPAVEDLAAAADVVQAGTRAISAVPAVADALQQSAAHIEQHVLTEERLGTLASAALDDGLTGEEDAELEALLSRAAREDLGAAQHIGALRVARHAGEALRAAAEAPAFTGPAARAGAAAVQAIAAEALQRAMPHQNEPTEVHWLGRVWNALTAVRTPLAFAGAAAVLFVVLRVPSPEQTDASSSTVASSTAAAGVPLARGEAEQQLLDALARALPPEEPPPAEDLPLLADNSAVVEALDATSTTMVFATDTSNITVIWVADTEDETEQGT